MSNRSRGFTLVEALLIVVILGIIGFVGWRVWEANMTVDEPVSQSTVVPNTKIHNEADLDQSATVLDNTDVVGNAEQELDAETNF